MFEILDQRAILQISGPDSQKYLQGITTNDVVNKKYTYNYLLNNQGRYLFDCFIYQHSVNNYFLDVAAICIDRLIKRMTLYKLRSNLTIKNVTKEYKILYSREKINDSDYSILDPRYNKLGYRSLVIENKINKMQVLTKHSYMSDKYCYSIIDGYLDLIEEKSIPIEYGAEELNAIDYKKGCYIGQEVISRAKYQGVIRKKIYKLSFAENIQANYSHNEVMDLQGNSIGRVCSMYNNLAIALIREEKYLGLQQKKVIVNGTVADISIPFWRS
ncbi:MAG: folate-binding protein YgfZ [Rickettsiaceae bacterium]